MASAPSGTVLVIGGSSGMGKAVAVASLGAGYSVLIASRSADKLAAAAAAIAAAAGLDAAAAAARITTGVIDVESEASVAAFFGGVKAGSISHLVSTVGAGVGCSSILGADGFAGLRKQFDVKFFAQVAAVSYGAPLLADGGCIVLTSGALAKRPGKGSTALATANAALEGLVKGLANDLGPRLRAVCVSPGLVDTEMWDRLPAAAKAGMLAGFGKSIPAGRAGTPADVASAVVFALTNGWVTGTVIDIDGGAAVRE
jgi:NAD(P)-dependent dehydrogenase (short-subunit alcohol dehydrogenase family)